MCFEGKENNGQGEGGRESHLDVEAYTTSNNRAGEGSGHTSQPMPGDVDEKVGADLGECIVGTTEKEDNP